MTGDNIWHDNLPVFQFVIGKPCVILGQPKLLHRCINEPVSGIDDSLGNPFCTGNLLLPFLSLATLNIQQRSRLDLDLSTRDHRIRRFGLA